jgi:hypothetical protein
VTVSGDTHELVVVDVSNPNNPSVGYSFDMSGSSSAKAIALEGARVFVGDGGFFRVVDISNPLSLSTLGSINTTSTEIFDIGSAVAYSQNGNRYVFLSTNLSSHDLVSVDITNPSSPAVSALYNDAVTQPFWGVAYSQELDKVFVSVNTSDGMRVFAPDPL